MQGIWKAECGCHQEHCESAEFHVTSCNIDMQVQVRACPPWHMHFCVVGFLRMCLPISCLQDMAMLSLSQWQDYYHVKKLSFDDPVGAGTSQYSVKCESYWFLAVKHSPPNASTCNAALILDMPMTLMWAVRQAREFFQDCSISSNHIVIHYLGNAICHTKHILLTRRVKDIRTVSCQSSKQ